MEAYIVNMGIDSKPFKDVFELFYPKLCYFAKTFIRRDDIAKDIVQEIFLKIYEKNNKYDSLGSFRSFIYQSVKNRCLDYLKHEKISNSYVSQMNYEERGDYVLSNMIETEIISNIYEAINKLPKECSKIMIMSLKGMKNQEIADFLQLSIYTVKAQKQRGLQLLKELLPSDLVTLLFIILQ